MRGNAQPAEAGSTSKPCTEPWSGETQTLTDRHPLDWLEGAQPDTDGVPFRAQPALDQVASLTAS